MVMSHCGYWLCEHHVFTVFLALHCLLAGLGCQGLACMRNLSSSMPSWWTRAITIAYCCTNHAYLRSPASQAQQASSARCLASWQVAEVGYHVGNKINNQPL